MLSIVHTKVDNGEALITVQGASLEEISGLEAKKLAYEHRKQLDNFVDSGIDEIYGPHPVDLTKRHPETKKPGRPADTVRESAELIKRASDLVAYQRIFRLRRNVVAFWR